MSERERDSDSDSDIEGELLHLEEEGNEQTWLTCIDGKKDVLYDLTDFLDVTKPLRSSYPIIQGEGSSKTITKQRSGKMRESSMKDMLKNTNPEFKENCEKGIKINTSQAEPTLYFQDIQKATPFSSSGSNIKRPSSMYDSFIEKICDRSLLEDVEMPKSNVSLVSLSFEEPSESSEKIYDKKIDSKTFTRPKKSQTRPKVKDPLSRKSFIDELAMRYSTEYVNVDAVSPDLDSPLDIGGRSLDVMSSTVEEKVEVKESGLDATFEVKVDPEPQSSMKANSTFTFQDEASNEVSCNKTFACDPQPGVEIKEKIQQTVPKVHRFGIHQPAKLPTIQDDLMEPFQPQLVSTSTPLKLIRPDQLGPFRKSTSPASEALNPTNKNAGEKLMRKVVSEENLMSPLKKPSYFSSASNLNNNNKNLAMSTESLPGPSNIPRPKPSGIPVRSSRIPMLSRIPKPSDKK